LPLTSTEYNRRYYIKHRERLLEDTKEYREKNRVQIRENARKYREENRDKIRTNERTRYLKNPIKFKKKSRKDTLKKYGMTPEQWNALFESQEQKCAICEANESSKWHTDHDHKTGTVRGILCHGCNVGLGHFKDCPDILNKAASYLEVYR
jgi:hypothetical protein